MTQEEIIAGNKTIGDFMGKNFKDPLNYMYDKEWNWIMPVVEKIAKTMYNDNEPDEVNDTAYPRTFGMLDEEGNFMVRFNRCGLFYSKSLIEATWLAVVEFIKSECYDTFKLKRY